MMTDTIQYKIRLDATLQSALQQMKETEDHIAIKNGWTKTAINSLITGKITKLLRTNKYLEILKLEEAYPDIYSQPITDDQTSVRISIRITDANINKTLDSISKRASRSKPDVIYTLLRHISKNHVKATHKKFQVA